MNFSTKDLERKAKEQKKEREEKQKRLSDLSAKLMKWFEDENFLVKDVVVVLQAISNAMQKQMESKTLPIVKEWNSKLVKDFYAANETETSAS